MRPAGLAVPVAIGIAVAVASCSSAPGTGNPTASATRSTSGAAATGSPTSAAAASTAGLVPSGYRRIGGVAQGISVAAPASWVPVNPTNETIESAAKKLGLSGFSASQLVQDFEAIQKLHGVLVFDVKSAVDSPQHIASNLNAYCLASGVTDVGATAVPLLTTSAAAELEKVGGTHITQKDLQIGGIPGVETSYQLSSSGAGTLYGSQLEVLPKPDKGCFVTLTTASRESAGDILSVAAATAQFP